jgi:hypothetical protein
MEVFRPVELTQPSYMKTYEWEKFDLTGWRRWVGQYWTLTIFSSVVYVAFIFSTQFIMRNRKPFRLTGVLTTWNSVLAVFSIIAFLRTVPEFIHVLAAPNGFHNSVCQWWVPLPRLTPKAINQVCSRLIGMCGEISGLHTTRLQHSGAGSSFSRRLLN